MSEPTSEPTDQTEPIKHEITYGVSNSATCVCGWSGHGVMAVDLDEQVDEHVKQAEGEAENPTESTDYSETKVWPDPPRKFDPFAVALAWGNQARSRQVQIAQELGVLPVGEWSTEWAKQSTPVLRRIADLGLIPQLAAALGVPPLDDPDAVGVPEDQGDPRQARVDRSNEFWDRKMREGSPDEAPESQTDGGSHEVGVPDPQEAPERVYTSMEYDLAAIERAYVSTSFTMRKRLVNAVGWGREQGPFLPGSSELIGWARDHNVIDVLALGLGVGPIRIVSVPALAVKSDPSQPSPRKVRTEGEERYCACGHSTLVHKPVAPHVCIRCECPSERITKFEDLPRNECLLTEPHAAHVWWYTSEGGGHMLVSPSDAKNGDFKKHWCLGVMAGDDVCGECGKSIRRDAIGSNLWIHIYAEPGPKHHPATPIVRHRRSGEPLSEVKRKGQETFRLHTSPGGRRDPNRKTVKPETTITNEVARRFVAGRPGGAQGREDEERVRFDRWLAEVKAEAFEKGKFDALGRVLNKVDAWRNEPIDSLNPFKER